MGGFLPKAGGFRKLKGFQLARVVYDLTVVFIDRFVPYKSRTRDQMEQAARSGVQNIAEGSKASATSKETEIKLTNVAIASLEELLLDYEDYLRQHNLPVWEKNHPQMAKMKAYLQSESFSRNPMQYASALDAERYCNMCLTLIHQASFLLQRLLERQQQQFLEQGGIREQMYRARINYRNNPNPLGNTPKNSNPPPQNPDIPILPK